MKIWERSIGLCVVSEQPNKGDSICPLLKLLPCGNPPPPLAVASSEGRLTEPRQPFSLLPWSCDASWPDTRPWSLSPPPGTLLSTGEPSLPQRLEHVQSLQVGIAQSSNFLPVTNEDSYYTLTETKHAYILEIALSKCTNVRFYTCAWHNISDPVRK